MMQCGLLGRKLGHSYSPAIHAQLGAYGYDLYEKEPEELEDFLLHGAFHGLNVTIPYKKAIVPYCTALSETAQLLQSVNTLVRRPDGTLYGANTDYDGFAYLLRRSGVEPAGKKALVLGSGGASVTVCAVLAKMGAQPVVISRTGENNYENLARHSDAQLLVNTTPVGMYPHNGAAAVDLTLFPHLAAVYDLIYNPARTALLLQAESLGIPAFGGLAMLVAQARRSSELFQNTTIGDEVLLSIQCSLRSQMENIVLIGMPGCGKSTVATELGTLLGREVLDSDALIEESAHMSIPEIFAAEGEADFRRRETQALAQLGKRSGIILATGGGCVTQPENAALLRQNGILIWLQRPLEALATEGRPLSAQQSLAALYQQRKPLYERFAHCSIENCRTPADTAQAIKEAFYEICRH